MSTTDTIFRQLLGLGHLDHLGYVAAISQSDHSSSPLWKIASSFFDSTNNAAFSARSLSLRRSSRSISLIRFRSAAVSLGLARCSSGSARAWVALERQASSSYVYTPFSRHQALRLDSSMSAVVITAPSQAAADPARSRACVVKDSARHRSNVSVDTPTSSEISSMEAVFGGSSLAITLFLNACPNRAIASSHHRPHSLKSMETTSIRTRGGRVGVLGRGDLASVCEYVPAQPKPTQTRPAPRTENAQPTQTAPESAPVEMADITAAVKSFIAERGESLLGAIAPDTQHIERAVDAALLAYLTIALETTRLADAEKAAARRIFCAELRPSRGST